MQQYKYFSDLDTKIACQCGCGLGLKDMSVPFMLRIEAAREASGVPFRVISGARCPKHNNNVSKTGFDGSHTTLDALDLAVRSSRERFRIRKALINQGFCRFGTGKNMLHVDGSLIKDQDVEWLY